MYKDYTQHLENYSSRATEESEDKIDFLDNDNPNIGYKCHLNVRAENVINVSNYLKKHGYCYKYLSGGEIESGKVFTIYIGSKAKVEELMPTLYESLTTYLSSPKASEEVLFAPKIVGRFCGSRKEFHQYGIRGISLLNGWNSILCSYFFSGKKDEIKTLSELAYKASHERLIELYGEYYGGGVKPYVSHR